MKDNKRRKCIRCKQIKVLNGYVFKKTKSKIGLAPSFDRVCVQCRKNEQNKEQNKHKRGVTPKLKQCKYRECTNTIRRVGFKYFCSDDCRRLEGMLDAQDRRDETNQTPRKKIDERFLKRGNIHYEGYAWQ